MRSFKPKPLVNLFGFPIIEHTIRKLKDHEIIVHSSFDSDEEYKALSEGDLANSTLSISIPTLTDPTLAPEKSHCVILFAPAFYCLKEGSWQGERARLTEELIKKAEKIIPGLSKSIVVKDSATPLTLERYTLNSGGSTLGWAPSPPMVFNRPPSRTPIKNLYLSGHWTLPGGGISGVISSGWTVARMIGGKG